MDFNLVLIIIIVTVGFSVLAFYDRKVMGRFIHSPYDVKHSRQWYRLLTSGFLHADWMHLLINMYVLYGFGPTVLFTYQGLFQMKGIWYFLLLYLGAIVISDLPSYKKHQDNPGYASLGASGAVSAIVFAFIFLYPTTSISMILIPIPLPAVVWGVIYLAYSQYMSRRGGDHINHSAHLTGALFGIIYTIALRPTLFAQFINSIRNLF